VGSAWGDRLRLNWCDYARRDVRERESTTEDDARNGKAARRLVHPGPPEAESHPATPTKGPSKGPGSDDAPWRVVIWRNNALISI
jgi:hypothetical protein